MDPAMVHTGHWAWGAGEMFRAPGVPRVVTSFFTAPAFYGMPLSNWLGWFVTAAVIARVVLVIAPPSVVADRLASSRLPVLLYLVNGVMPVALCMRDRLWWAAGLGAAGMLAVSIPALAPARRPVPSPALSEARPPVVA
jgi:putative membrane protein